MYPYSAGDKFTNLNFHSDWLPLERAVSLTSGSECGAPGDYLAWGDMELRLTGEHRQEQRGQGHALCQQD